MSLEKPNCYDCAHHFHCSFRRSIDNAIEEHIGWVNVDMASPVWQNLFVTLAEACIEFTIPSPSKTPEEKKLKKPVTKSISCCPKCGNALVTTIMGRRCLDRACDFAIVDEQERQAFMRNPQGLG